MSSRRILSFTVLFIAILFASLVASGAFLGSPSGRPAGAGDPTARAGGPTPKARGAQEELEEHAEVNAERIEAARAAARRGELGQTGPIEADAAPGWYGQRLFDRRGDDWEPAIAADPVSSHVYILTTRYGGPTACKSNCPSPAIILEISRDGGKTWSDGRFLCVCRRVKGQFDPEIEVTAKGTVYAAWMNGFNVFFAKSRDHGRTWTEPVPVYGHLPWVDKPILATTASGRDVYIAMNRSDSYIAQSHDFGASWAKPIRTNSDDRYYFAGGGYVAPGGRVTFSETSYTQSSTGPVRILSITSRDRGRTWKTTRVDTVEQQPDCVSEGCPLDFYGPQAAVAGDSTGAMVIAYQGASVPMGPQRMYVRRSTDGGASWGARASLSPPGANAAFPAAAGTAAGDMRVWFMDDRRGRDYAWNTWYRRSTDGGATWSRVVRISDATSGTGYKTSRGFAEPYGDYGELAVDAAGRTHAVWGEGFSYFGPGGTWYNRTR